MVAEDRESWAFVTSVSPLRVRVDGDSSSLSIAPQSLVAEVELWDRVRVKQISGGPTIVTGIKGRNLSRSLASPTRTEFPYPTGFGWHADYDDIAPHITRMPTGFAYGDAEITPAALFGQASTALSAPTNTFYVDVATGSDANDGLTSGNAFFSLLAARNAVNAKLSTAKCKVYVKGGIYGIGAGFSGTGTTGAGVNRDTAWVAYDGPVTTGSFFADASFSSFAVDATRTLTYSRTAPGYTTTRVVDLVTGVELTEVETGFRCQSTPNSWAIDAGKLYIRRSDSMGPPTSKTTRVFLDLPVMYARTAVNLFLGSEDDSPWVLQGGMIAGSWSNGGALWVDMLTPTGTNHTLVCDGVSFDYAGAAGASTNGVTLQRWEGLAAFFNCSGKAPAKDGLNVSNDSYSEARAAGSYILTVNCDFTDSGRGNNVSCNSQTAHALYVHWIDVAGVSTDGKGGTVRHVGSSQTWMIGARVSNDRGDLFTLTGTTPPTAVRADGDAEIWLDKCLIDQPGGGYAIVATESAQIHLHETIVRGTQSGAIDTY